MGKIYLHYQNFSDAQLGDILKVKIDDTITAEIKRNEVYELELVDGNHNLKMYYEGWSSDELVGYIDQNVEIMGDTYFTYKGPKTIYGKGNLIKRNFKDSTEFYKKIHKSNTIVKILGIILFIAALFCFLFL